MALILGALVLVLVGGAILHGSAVLTGAHPDPSDAAEATDPSRTSLAHVLDFKGQKVDGRSAEEWSRILTASRTDGPTRVPSVLRNAHFDETVFSTRRISGVRLESTKFSNCVFQRETDPQIAEVETRLKANALLTADEQTAARSLLVQDSVLEHVLISNPMATPGVGYGRVIVDGASLENVTLEVRAGTRIHLTQSVTGSADQVWLTVYNLDRRSDFPRTADSLPDDLMPTVIVTESTVPARRMRIGAGVLVLKPISDAAGRELDLITLLERTVEIERKKQAISRLDATAEECLLARAQLAELYLMRRVGSDGSHARRQLDLMQTGISARRWHKKPVAAQLEGFQKMWRLLASLTRRHPGGVQYAPVREWAEWLAAHPVRPQARTHSSSGARLGSAPRIPRQWDWRTWDERVMNGLSPSEAMHECYQIVVQSSQGTLTSDVFREMFRSRCTEKNPKIFGE